MNLHEMAQGLKIELLAEGHKGIEALCDEELITYFITRPELCEGSMITYDDALLQISMSESVFEFREVLSRIAEDIINDQRG